MTKYLLLAAATAIAVPAAAQDTSRDDYFNGFYIGGTVGLDHTANSDRDGLVFDTNRDGSFTESVNTVAGANAFSPGFCNGTAVANNRAAGCTKDDDDIGYSIRAGYDTRLGTDSMFVAGLLVEAAKSDSIDYVTGFSTTPASYTVARNLDHSFALRGRVGISPGDGRGLFYVTGGVAYGKIDHAFTTSNTANSFTQTDEDDYRLGGQIGGGVEFSIARNISIGLEYLHQEFQDDDYFVAVGAGTAPATNPFLIRSGGTNLRPASSDYSLDSFRVGLNFRF